MKPLLREGAPRSSSRPEASDYLLISTADHADSNREGTVDGGMVQDSANGLRGSLIRCCAGANNGEISTIASDRYS